MTDLRKRVRERASLACEYCGVSENDTGGQLTIDHFQPKSKGGTDDFDNLLYCCIRCNQFKQDYWPTDSSTPSLWNPHTTPFSQHFHLLDDGTVHPLTTTGAFTLNRLRLNRPPLVAYRLNKLKRTEDIRLLNRYRDLVVLLEELQGQLSEVTREQQLLIREQQELLNILLRK